MPRLPWSVVLVALLASVVAFALAPVAVTSGGIAGSAPTHLHSCSTITESGRYVLTDDIDTGSGTCFRIEADDVRFDGGGHVVDGHRLLANSTAVEVTGRNVTLRNVAVATWTFGVRYENASDGTVANVRTWRTGDGVTVADSPRTTIAGVTAANGFTGISMSDSDDSRIADSVVRDTSSAGVFVADSERVTVTNVSITRSKTGLDLLGVRDGRVVDVVVRSTAESILLVDSRDNRILNATLSNPGSGAVVMRVNASDNRLVGTDGNWTTHETPGTTRAKKTNDA